MFYRVGSSISASRYATEDELEDREVYDGLFLTWHEQLLLGSFVAACPSSVVAMPLGSVGKGR
jgi:hypothetical protein